MDLLRTWRSRRVSALTLAASLLAGSTAPAQPASQKGEPAPARAERPDAVTRRTVSLREALALASTQSPNVIAARFQAQAARAGVQRAWAAWKPQLTATAQLIWTSAPAELSTSDFILGVGPLYGLPPPPPQALAQLPGPITIIAEWTRQANVQLSQPLFSPQGLFLIGAAKAGEEAASLGADEAREQVLLAVARTYLGAQGVEQLLDAARQAEEVAQRRERDARVQLEVGTGVEVDLLRAQTDTAQSRAQIAQLEGQRIQLLSLLQALTGEAIAPTREFIPEAAFLEASREEDAPWENTYAVRASRKQVEALQQTVRFDDFSWLPTLAVAGQGAYSSVGGFQGTNLVANASLVANWTLYDRGLRYAQRDEDLARLNQARASLEGSLATSRANWLAAQANLAAAQAALQQAEAQADLAARAQKQVEAAEKAGVSTSLELQDADTRAFLAASALAQARTVLETRRVELIAAEGRIHSAIQGAAKGQEQGSPP